MSPDRPPVRPQMRRPSAAVLFAAIALGVIPAGCRFEARPSADPRTPPAAAGPVDPAGDASPIPTALRPRLTAWDHSVPVVAVLDGDTIRVATGQHGSESVRLIGLNAPEARASGAVQIQCFGVEAAEHLAALIGDAEVWLAGDPTQRERDRYDRLLAYVWLPDGTLLNKALIADGYASEATYDGPYVLRDTFRAAAAAARRAGRGLWAPDTCDGDFDAPALR